MEICKNTGFFHSYNCSFNKYNGISIFIQDACEIPLYATPELFILQIP